MPQRHAHVADIDAALKVPYSAVKRTDRGKWVLVFNDDRGERQRVLTAHDIRAKTPPQDFHADAVKAIRESYRPAALFPSLSRKGWDDLLDEVERTGPTIRPETRRSFRAAAAHIRPLPSFHSSRRASGCR